MFEKPPGPRHIITEHSDVRQIRIPAKRNFLILAFLSLWLCGWLAGEIMVPLSFFQAKTEPAAVGFTLVWLGLWTLGGGFAGYIWLWHVKGCEVISISPTALSIQRAIFGFGRTRHYDVTEIRQLRVAPFTFNPFDFRSGMAFWGIGGGTISFDYCYKTFRFGAGIDEAEARVILRTITDRLPCAAATNSVDRAA